MTSASPHPSHIPHSTLLLTSAHALSSAGFLSTTTEPLNLLATVLESYIGKLARSSVELASLGVGRGGGLVGVEDVVEVLESEGMGTGMGRARLVYTQSAPVSAVVPPANPGPAIATSASMISASDSVPSATTSEAEPILKNSPLQLLLDWVDQGEWGRAGDGENCLIGGLEDVKARNAEGLFPVYPEPGLPALPLELTSAFASSSTFRKYGSRPRSSSSVLGGSVAGEKAGLGRDGEEERRKRRRIRMDSGSETDSGSSSSLWSASDKESDSSISSHELAGVKPKEGKRLRRRSRASTYGLGDEDHDGKVEAVERDRHRELKVQAKRAMELVGQVNGDGQSGQTNPEGGQDKQGGIATDIDTDDKDRRRVETEAKMQSTDDDDEAGREVPIDEEDEGYGTRSDEENRGAINGHGVTNGSHHATSAPVDARDGSADGAATRKHRRRHGRRRRADRDLLFAVRLGMFVRMKAIMEADDGDAWGGVLPPLPGTEAFGLGAEDQSATINVDGETDAMDVDEAEGSEAGRARSATPSTGQEIAEQVDSAHVLEETLEAIATTSRTALGAYTMDPIPYTSSVLSKSHPSAHISRFHKRLRTRNPPALYPSTLPDLLEAYSAANKQAVEPNVTQTPIYRKSALEIMAATTADPLLYERAGTTMAPAGFASSSSGALPKGNPFVPSYPIYGKNSQPVNADHEGSKELPEVYPTRPVSLAPVQASYLSRGLAHPPPSTLNPLEPRLLGNMLAEITGNPAKPETSRTPYLSSEVLAELTSLRPPLPLKPDGNQPALFGDAVFAPGQLDAEGQAKAKKLKLQKEKTLKLKLTLGGDGALAGGKGKSKAGLPAEEAERDEIYLGATWDIGDAGDWTQWNETKTIPPSRILTSAWNKSLDTYLAELHTPSISAGQSRQLAGVQVKPGSSQHADSTTSPFVASAPTPKIRLSFGRPPSGLITPIAETTSSGPAPAPRTQPAPTEAPAALPEAVTASEDHRSADGPLQSIDRISDPSKGSYFDPLPKTSPPARVAEVSRPAQSLTVPAGPTPPRTHDIPRAPIVSSHLSGLAGLPPKPQVLAASPSINAGVMAAPAAGVGAIGGGVKLKFKLGGPRP